MPPFALPDLQAAFAAHLLGTDRADLESSVTGDAIPARGRLAIYRNHVRISLTAALAATFPVVHRLVGEPFFASVARQYIEREPPRGPVLAEYGDTFAVHLAAEQRLEALPYVPDVAKLEWALNLAWMSARAVPLTAAALATVAAAEVETVKLWLQPGTTLVRSRWPIDRVWHANQAQGEVEEIDLGAGSARLLVFRRADDAAFAPLSEGEGAFVDALLSGRGLGAAAEAAMATGQEFDLSECLTHLLNIEALAGPWASTEGAVPPVAVW